MKAIRLHQTGGAEVLQLTDVTLPPPTSAQTRIRVELAGVNFIDIYHRRGQYQVPLPSGIGIEGIGSTHSGERYFWLNAMGSYAQEINLTQEALTRIPDHAPPPAALLPLLCQGLTAHYLADSAFPIARGDSALVTAAAGGVGLLLIQILKSRGAKVIAAASTKERALIAENHGADISGVYSEISEMVAESTSGHGVTVVYDSVGKDYFDRCLESLATTGMFVLYGGASGPVPPFDLMRLNPRSLAIQRPTLSAYTATSQERERRLAELLTLRAQGSLRYPDAQIFPIADARSAHHLIESRTYSGKIGLDPWKI